MLMLLFVNTFSFKWWEQSFSYTIRQTVPHYYSHMSVIKLIFALLSLTAMGSNSDITPRPVDARPTIEINVDKPSTSNFQLSTTAATNTTAIAQCLTEKGAKFYGAFWCPHCADQKESFGNAMTYVNYVECDPRGENANPDACLEADIVSYPTWIFANGERLVGTRTPQELAQQAGCL